MESLESKLDRLSPDQRKEVEDFVDFLMYRSGNSPGVPVIQRHSSSPPEYCSPPLTLSEPVHFGENPLINAYNSHQEDNSPLPVKDDEQVKPIQEIIVGGEDRISREFMDYGQFEQKSSPATVAVKNVKEKDY